jgi:hypothetical protein
MSVRRVGQLPLSHTSSDRTTMPTRSVSVTPRIPCEPPADRHFGQQSVCDGRHAQPGDANERGVGAFRHGAAAEPVLRPQSRLAVEERVRLGAGQAAVELEAPHGAIREHGRQLVEVLYAETPKREPPGDDVAQRRPDGRMQLRHGTTLADPRRRGNRASSPVTLNCGARSAAGAGSCRPPAHVTFNVPWGYPRSHKRPSSAAGRGQAAHLRSQSCWEMV